MIKFVRLRRKTYSYLKINKQKAKKSVIKRKLKFEDDKNCLEVTQLENKINHLEENKIDINSLRKDRKEFIKSNKLILKTEQRFKIERHNVFTEEINKIALSSSGDKRMHSIDLIETYAHETNKDLARDKEEIIKRYKND